MTQPEIDGLDLPPDEGWMYWATDASNLAAWLKVGYTKAPRQRARSLRRGSVGLIIRSWWPATVDDERDFHAAHITYRIPNEAWHRELYFPVREVTEDIIATMRNAYDVGELRVEQGSTVADAVNRLRDMCGLYKYEEPAW